MKNTIGNQRRSGNLYTFAIILAMITVITVTHEAAHYVTAKRNGVKIIEASFGFGPSIFTYTKNGTKYSISAIPMGGYVSMSGEQDRPAIKRSHSSPQFNAQPDSSQLSILLAGPLINILTGSILILILNPPTAKKPGTRIAETLDGYPAKAAGVLPGDTITQINDTPVNTANDINRLFKRLPAEKPITLAILRDQMTLQITIQPRPEKALSPILLPVKIPLIGITLSRDKVKAKDAIPLTIKEILQPIITTVALPLTLPLAVITRHIKLSQFLTGPVGLFYITKSLLSSGKTTALELFSVVSISVGFTNILPIPIMDGGRAAIIMAEKASQAPLSETASQTANLSGAMILLALLVFTTYTDISKVRRGRKENTDFFDITRDPLF